MSNVISQVSGTIKNWWAFLIIGILLIIASYWIFSTPAESFVSLSFMFSMLIFLSGLFSVFFAITNKDDIENFGLYLAGGILDIVVGFILMKYPGITVVLFSLFIGFWLMFRGFNTISISFKVKKLGDTNWFWILLLGTLIVIFAFMAIVNPMLGAGYLVITLALALLTLGVANIVLALRLRKVKSKISDVKDALS